jgi:orotidine-5'-phosphate decarboxylase
MHFLDKLQASSQVRNSRVCVGLDPDPEKLPAVVRQKHGNGLSAVKAFLVDIIQATAGSAACYKPNLAFFESFGGQGWETLREIVRTIPRGIPAILDAKRGDIGNTAQAYARSLFEWFAADAVTVNPYMGTDSLLPFLGYQERGVFVLCLTSNPGAADFQLLKTEGGIPLYIHVARKIDVWKRTNQNVGLVAGATRPEMITSIREAAPDCPLLIPGVGAQGGDLAAAVKTARGRGDAPFVINASRSILYAGSGPDYAEQSAAACSRMAREIEQVV